ncbi:TIM barrel protein [Anaerofilum sp. BX8]|uniref:TIM barrel protein n=1 Tax=Anaerofilum hominis TaxID=2763016 RepID=A0A923L262_9FIRM|nr:TIM barrel protein [Anaerofilum hominis]MBC5582494.1 TIM barrel protein [Anaerofilum hominis]
MKIALLSLLFRHYHLEKVFQVASEQGYDGVEIWGGRPQAYPYDMDEARCEEVLRMKEQYHLEVPMYTPEVLGYPFNIATTDEKERSETIDYLKRAIDVSRAIGAPRVQLAAGHAGHGTNRRKNRENVVYVLKTLADHAEKMGIDLVLEAVTLMESNVVIFLDDLVELIEEVGSPRLKGMLDTVTPTVHWETFADYFEKLGDNMAYIHFIDSDGRDQHHFPLGEGKIPLQGLMAILRKYGYDGWLSSELVSPYGRDPELFAAQEIRSIRRVLEYR